MILTGYALVLVDLLHVLCLHLTFIQSATAIGKVLGTWTPGTATSVEYSLLQLYLHFHMLRHVIGAEQHGITVSH